MAKEFYIQCPKCNHVYNVHKMIYDQGVEFRQLCPLCLNRFTRKEAKIISSNFTTKS